MVSKSSSTFRSSLRKQAKGSQRSTTKNKKAVTTKVLLHANVASTGSREATLASSCSFASFSDFLSFSFFATNKQIQNKIKLFFCFKKSSHQPQKYEMKRKAVSEAAMAFDRLAFDRMTRPDFTKDNRRKSQEMAKSVLG